MAPPTPAVVLDAQHRAADLGFLHSCEPPTGPTLSVLSAAVTPGGRILEIGTGAGVGTAWIVAGLEGRPDVDVVTIEHDRSLADLMRAAGLPISVLHGDAEALLPGLGSFDLVFADAEGGKWTGLDLTLAALAPGGVLLVDDMDLDRYDTPAHRAAVTRVRDTLLRDSRLLSVELAVGTGLILATRRIR